MDPASQNIEGLGEEFTREELEICDDVSQFIMFVIALSVATILFLILREIYPDSSYNEPEKTTELNGAGRFWIAVYLFITGWMLYAWGYRPILKFMRSCAMKGRRAEISKKITNVVTPLAIILGAFLMGGTMGMEFLENLMPESLETFMNVAFLVALFMTWKVIEYARYAAIRKALGQRVIKDAPWLGLLKLLSYKA